MMASEGDAHHATEDFLFRVMGADPDGKPQCGDATCQLGVRILIDVTPIDGRVGPGKGGMSVTPNPATLHPHFRPVALGGRGKLPLFRTVVRAFGGDLRYAPDVRTPPRHGLVEPSRVMLIAAYQAALAATRDSWAEVK